MVEWSAQSAKTCLQSAVRQWIKKAEVVEVNPDINKVPSQYYDLRQVFDKTRTTSLPPHRPYDCSIELLPDTMPPQGRLFPLSVPEQKAMSDYISEAQRAGLIRLSSSLARVE